MSAVQSPNAASPAAIPPPDANHSYILSPAGAIIIALAQIASVNNRLAVSRSLSS
jgi:hypothetical protein